jgi:hypothetical protein
MRLRLHLAIALFCFAAASPVMSLATDTTGIQAPTSATVVAIAHPAVRSSRPLGSTRAAGTTLYVNQEFSYTASYPNVWHFGGNACLTAGTAALTPPTSVPACGSSAPLDSPGNGALELTPPQDWQQGYVYWKTPIPTAGGLVMNFDYYSFNSSASNGAGDGAALILSDASIPNPNDGIGGCCASFLYAPWSHPGNTPEPGLVNAWVAVGLDESGWWTCATACNGKTGGSPVPVPNIITVRGAAQTNWTYLLSSVNASGKPGPLPFALSAGSSTKRPTPLTFSVTLTATGTLSVTIDRHNGTGPVAYIKPTPIVGLNGQPAVPANVFFALAAGSGDDNARHQIANVTVSSLH